MQFVVAGVVSSVKESYGFLQILSADCGTGIGDAQLFFHFNELYESTNTPVVVGDEIEFTVSAVSFVLGLTHSLPHRTIILVVN